MKNKLFCALKWKNSKKFFQVVQTRGREEPRKWERKSEVYKESECLANMAARKSIRKTPASEKPL